MSSLVPEFLSLIFYFLSLVFSAISYAPKFQSLADGIIVIGDQHPPSTSCGLSHFIVDTGYPHFAEEKPGLQKGEPSDVAEK